MDIEMTAIKRTEHTAEKKVEKKTEQGIQKKTGQEVENDANTRLQEQAKHISTTHHPSQTDIKNIQNESQNIQHKAGQTQDKLQKLQSNYQKNGKLSPQEEKERAQLEEESKKLEGQTHNLSKKSHVTHDPQNVINEVNQNHPEHGAHLGNPEHQQNLKSFIQGDNSEIKHTQSTTGAHTEDNKTTEKTSHLQATIENTPNAKQPGGNVAGTLPKTPGGTGTPPPEMGSTMGGGTGIAPPEMGSTMSGVGDAMGGGRGMMGMISGGGAEGEMIFMTETMIHLEIVKTMCSYVSKIYGMIASTEQSVSGNLN